MSTRQGIEAKAKILDAAEELMSRFGYSGTSISKICKMSDLSASAIYFHFESKAGVVAATLERGINRYLDEAERAASEPNASAVDGLKRLFDVIEEKPQALRLAIIIGMEEGPEHGVGGESVAKVRSRGRALIGGLVARSIGKAPNDPRSQSLAAFTLAALDGAVVMGHLDGPRLSEVMAPVFDLLQTG